MVATMAQASDHDRLFGTSRDFPRLVEIDIGHIECNPDQPRRHFDESETAALAESIARHGLQQPILVRQEGASFYRLVAGERRLRAHQVLGKPTIFAILTDGDPDELALIENLQRVDLNALEVAYALSGLIEKHGYTHAHLGGIIGRSQAEVTRTLRLLEIPKDIQGEYTTSYHQIPKSVMIEIAATEGEDNQRVLWDHAKAGATVKQVRDVKKQGTGTSRSSLTGGGAILRATGGLSRHLRALEEQRVKPTAEERAHLEALRTQIDDLLGGC